MSTARVTLDDPVFVGRLRQFSRGTPFVHVPKQVAQPTVIRDVVETPVRIERLIQPSTTSPAKPRLERSEVLQRNITTVPTVVKKKPRIAFGQKLLMAMASMVFIAGMAVAALGFKTNKHVEAQAAAVTQKAEEEAISEDKPTESQVRSYQVDPSLPRVVRISKLGVYARIQRQGVDKTGALKAPGNVHNAGWYENSSKPGEGGAMLLDGHVAGPTQRGVFYNIKNLKAGDAIEVERGDGQKFTYKVVKSVVSDVKNTDMTAALLPVSEGKAGLNLMTCTGPYDSKSGEYTQRITVFAEQV